MDMNNLNFIEHTGSTIPVDPETIVVYRTTSIPTPVSHIHHPIKAGKLTWSDEDQYMGSILEYAVIKVAIPKIVVDNDDNAEFIPLLGYHD